MKVAVMYAATKGTMLYEHYMATATQRDLSKRGIHKQLVNQNPHAVRSAT